MDTNLDRRSLVRFAGAAGAAAAYLAAVPGPTGAAPGPAAGLRIVGPNGSATVELHSRKDWTITVYDRQGRECEVIDSTVWMAVDDVMTAVAEHIA